MKRVMSIATSDSGAGAGIQADLKAFLRCGVYGTTAIVATTTQSTVGVTDIYPFPPRVATAQIEAVVEDIGADAVKTGMLFNAPIISAVADDGRGNAAPTNVTPPIRQAFRFCRFPDEQVTPRHPTSRCMCAVRLTEPARDRRSDPVSRPRNGASGMLTLLRPNAPQRGGIPAPRTLRESRRKGAREEVKMPV